MTAWTLDHVTTDEIPLNPDNDITRAREKSLLRHHGERVDARLAEGWVIRSVSTNFYPERRTYQLMTWLVPDPTTARTAQISR